MTKAEAAADQYRVHAVAARRFDQGLGAGVQFKTRNEVEKGLLFSSRQHADALAQRGVEIEFAVHRPFGNRRDFIAETEARGNLVERLGGDDGHIHVADQQPVRRLPLRKYAMVIVDG